MSTFYTDPNESHPEDPGVGWSFQRLQLSSKNPGINSEEGERVPLAPTFLSSDLFIY